MCAQKVLSGQFKLANIIKPCIISFVWFSGDWILRADVSEHSFFILICRVHTTYEDGTDSVFRNVGI